MAKKKTDDIKDYIVYSVVALFLIAVVATSTTTASSGQGEDSQGCGGCGGCDCGCMKQEDKDGDGGNWRAEEARVDTTRTIEPPSRPSICDALEPKTYANLTCSRVVDGNMYHYIVSYSVQSCIGHSVHFSIKAISDAYSPEISSGNTAHHNQAPVTDTVRFSQMALFDKAVMMLSDQNLRELTCTFR